MKKILILFLIPLLSFSQNFNYGILINSTGSGWAYVTIKKGNEIIYEGTVSEFNTNSLAWKFIGIDDLQQNEQISVSYELGYAGGSSCTPQSFVLTYNDFNNENFETINYACSDPDDGIHGDRSQSITFMPIHLISPDNRSICENQTIAVAIGYNWQYTTDTEINNNTWYDFPSIYQQARQISFSLSELNINNATKLIIKGGVFAENSIDNTDHWINTLTFDITPLPPTVIDDPNTTEIEGIIFNPPLCYGDGSSLSFRFEEDLVQNQNLTIELYKKDSGGLWPAQSLASITIDQLTTHYDNSGNPDYYEFVWDENSIDENGNPAGLNIDDTGDYKVNFKSTTNNNDSCQSVDKEFTISNFPTQVNFTATKIQDVSCNGGDDGQIEITANGGTGEYQYSLDGGSTWTVFTSNPTSPDPTQTITEYVSVSQGDYNIYVKDLNGCNGVQTNTSNTSISVTISQPAEFSASITGNDFACPESTETSIVIENVSGGTQTYKYKYKSTSDTHWLPSDTTWYNISNPNLTNISIFASGTYIVQVTDAKECIIIESTITINKPDEISLSYSVTNPTCYDAADGSISGTISGGTLGNDYTFTIDYRDENNVGNTTTTNSDGTFTISNLPNGTYTLTVSNVSNCSKTFDNIKLNQTQVEYSLEKIKDVSCFNGDDGEIKIVANGGTGQYQYSTDNGSTWTSFDNNPSDPNPSDSITQLVFLSEGNYTVLVKDLSNCSGTLISGENPVTITAPQSIEINNLTVIDVSSSGSTDGSFSLNVSEGTPGYEYELIKDNNSIDQGNIDYNNSTGTYDLSIDNLDEGTYQLIITDANGCNYIDPDTDQNYKEIIIGVIQDLSISLQKTNIDCYGYNNGSLTAEVTGGVQPYSYEWQKEEAGTWQTLSQTGNSISNLSPGNYKCIVSCDYHGTILTAEATELIEEPAEVTFDVSKHDISCPDGNDGYITIEATGGSGEYQYNTNDGTGWHEFTNTPTTPNPSNTVTEQISLVAGVYTIEVKDLNACEGVNTNNNTQIEITEPNPFVFDIISQQDPTAHNINDGQIVISVAGGTTDTGQYQFGYQNVTLYDQNGDSYSLSGADLNSDPVQFTFNQLPGGNYYLYVKDANNCEADSYNTNNINDYIHLTQPGQLSVNIELVTPIDCHGNNTGVIKAIGDGGIVLGPNDNNGLPYHYNWQKQVDGTWQDLGIDDMIIRDLEAATYKVIITDANGITAEAQYLLTEPDEIILNMSATQISCYPGSDGTATVNITGGTPPYQKEWRNTNQTIIDTTKTIKNLIAGTYTVTVTDAHSCRATADITLQQPGGMEVNEILQDPTCYGYNDGSIEVSVSGGQPPYTYIWAVNTTHDSPLLENLTAGTYDLSIIDANKCKAEVVIVLKDPEPLMIELGPDITLCSNQSVDFDISIDDPNAVYSWESDNGFASQSPTVHITDAGTYTATITYSAGCISSDQITISTSNEVVIADFLVTSQAFAGEDIILINTSNPMGDQTEWEVPTGVQIVEQNNETITLHFDNPGLYDISLISHQGDCIAVETKTIIVNEARDLPQVESDGNKFIQKFKVYPNPSNGNFKVKVELEKTADISLRLFSLTSNVPIDDQIKHGEKEYEMNYTVNKPAGTYFLLLETNGKREIRKIVIE